MSQSTHKKHEDASVVARMDSGEHLRYDPGAIAKMWSASPTPISAPVTYDFTAPRMILYSHRAAMDQGRMGSGEGVEQTWTKGTVP
ncbi:hypothetical protein AAF712_011095 [Marasmius tenuissimus]|uniref:Uncharacterized protein n=1 Tax=Marasmius tenuissimus TaxID=585030 RepID=A0ABR2ZLH5_9AGAR|nr:hypothetical protein PM082_011043 [Marasmius tenuissimus]KAJ8094297.1 hypothetical protein PM082_006837 [Marasmius tenuissimus]